ncbi:hypothetical protein WJX73_007185 [Symbiochloris irregularis]|uniref:folate gamma-glutamyl hydrolase n=1 Tax=Symbiochloris irregularis TaxID=706552 RepID=A0AAW1NY53_9CHLO
MEVSWCSAGLLFASLLLSSASASQADRLFRTSAQASAPSVQLVNERPIIGVLSQPGSPAPKGYSYIAASYVKFIESSGGRVIPIEYDLPVHELKRRFEIINGVLIPGGAQALSPHHPFYDAVAVFVDLAKQAFDKGDYFPIHGTCLGFEALAIVAANNASVLTEFDADNFAGPLNLTEAAHGSRLFSSMPQHVVKALQEQTVAMQNHAHGVGPKAFEEHKALRDEYRVLSLNTDRRGQVYVSTMESPDYPITAVQWHPEKNTFEWSAANHLHIPHSPMAIEVQRAFADFFISEARKNFHAPADNEEEDALLIYNNKRIFTGKHHFEGEETDFDECFIFPERKAAALDQSVQDCFSLPFSRRAQRSVLHGIASSFADVASFPARLFGR